MNTMPREGRIPTPLIRDCISPLLSQRRPGAQILGLQRSPAPYRSSWWLENLELLLDDGTVCRLVLKDLSMPVTGSNADRIKPGSITNLQREPWVYRAILGPEVSGPPAFWGVGTEGRRSGGWLFLEQVRGVPLSEVGDFGAWRDAAAWLGRFHTRLGKRGVPDHGPLLRHDEELYRWWFRRAMAREGPGRLGRLEAIHQRAVRTVLRSDPTVLHGEFYPSNILVDRQADGFRIRPVDWEMAGFGPAAWDLAALVSGEWSAGDRRKMAAAYVAAAEAAGSGPLPLDRFLRKVTACRLLLAIQWLGWSSEWTPPVEHRQNWLEEAYSCAEQL